MIIHDVEQNTPEWLLLRAGIPTASAFSKLVTTAGKLSTSLEVYAQTLAANKYANGEVEGFEGNKWTERGHDLEPEAASSYEFVNDVVTEKIGFVTNDDETIGCSPDRFVGKKGLVEIKCLKAENHVAAILYYKKNGVAPVKHFQQVQGQMMICERKWCDLVFYHPTLPLLVIRQNIDGVFIGKLLDAITEVTFRRDEIIKVMDEI